MVANPSLSSRQIEVQSGISRRRALNVLKKYKFKPYSVLKQHHLQPIDYQRRIDFCSWYCQKMQHDVLFYRNVIWTDEAHISSAGIFNRHNEHYWSDVNPHHAVNVRNQGRFGFNVWCALLGSRILNYCIFEGNLNSQRYHQIINNHIVEEYLDTLPLYARRKLYFQMDGAPSHNARQTSELLNAYFGNNWIGNNGPVRWPPRSPDLTPLDFFLWGHLKDKLYKNTNNSINELCQNFIDCINSISNIHIHNATSSVLKRCNLCLTNNGRQFEKFM